MKRVLYLLLLLPFSIISVKALSQENANIVDDKDYEVVAETIKYYKTTTVHNTLTEYSTFSTSATVPLSETIEVTKEEYENYEESNISPRGNGYIETNYKKMTTRILANGTAYRYEVVLDWKNMPATRSYDIIGVGYYASVKAAAISYQTDYCLSNGSCYNSTAHYQKNTSIGSGAVFKLPDNSNLSSLRSTLVTYMNKNTSSTIISQIAVGDYAHAQKSLTSTLAKDYTIGTIGIGLTNSNVGYYDAMSEAEASISCNW